MRREEYVCDFCGNKQEYQWPASGPRVTVQAVFSDDRSTVQTVDVCPDCVSYKGLGWISPADVLAGCRVLRAPTHEAWRQARHQLLTASDVAAVMGLSPYATRERILRAKLGPVGRDAPSEAMEAGSFLEEGLVRWFLRRRGGEGAECSMCRTPEGVSTLVLHPDAPDALAASPDAIVVLTAGGTPELVEAKVTNPRAWAADWDEGAFVSEDVSSDNYKFTIPKRIGETWKELTGREWLPFGPPLRHWVQLQTQLACTGLRAGWVVGCCGTERRDYRFEADAAFQAHIVRAAVDFRADVLRMRAQGNGGEHG